MQVQFRLPSLLCRRHLNVTVLRIESLQPMLLFIQRISLVWIDLIVVGTGEGFSRAGPLLLLGIFHCLVAETISKLGAKALAVAGVVVAAICCCCRSVCFVLRRTHE